jgi:signal peptidase II
MIKIKFENLKFGLVSAFFVILLDQLTKFIVFKHFAFQGQSVKIFPFLNFTYVQNKGISFGMFNSGSLAALVFILFITFVILSVVFYWLNKEKSNFTKIVLGLIIGGAFGNLIDRFTYGFVVDFIDFHAYAHHYPSFNVADSSICIAVILLLLTSKKTSVS